MRCRWVGIGVVVLLAVAGWHGRAGERPGGRAGEKGGDAALVRRGEYLVNEVAHCSHCHTPPAAKGQPDRTHLLQGATLSIKPIEKTDQ